MVAVLRDAMERGWSFHYLNFQYCYYLNLFYPINHYNSPFQPMCVHCTADSEAVKAICLRLVKVDMSDRISKDLCEQCVKVRLILI